MYTHLKQIVKTGTPVDHAQRAVIMLHGRGSTAENIISLTRNLNLRKMAIYAPKASKHSWYPFNFLVPVANNQPALSSALYIIDNLVKEILSHGIPSKGIFFLGFSQGACLALEYAARHAKEYGSIIAFTGGLIGETVKTDIYSGDFNHTPVLITTGDPDLHIPLSRVEETVSVFKDLNADVTLKVYKDRPHTIQFEEIVLANRLILNKLQT